MKYVLPAVMAFCSAMTAQVTKTSTGTGNWNTATTWSPSGVPTSTDVVSIGNGHIVSLVADAACKNLIVGGGTSGTLRYTGLVPLTMSVVNVTVNAGGAFNILSTSVATHSLYVSGDILVSGSFDMRRSATVNCVTTFNGTGNQSVSGTATLVRFGAIVLNMGISAANMLDITSSPFTTTAGYLTLLNGTFRFSSPGLNSTPYNTTVTIPSTAGMIMNAATSTLNLTMGFTNNGTFSVVDGRVNVNAAVTNAGTVKVSGGYLKVGNASNEDFIATGGTLAVSDGYLDIAGKYDGSATASTFSLTGGIVTLPTSGSGNTTLAPFQASAPGSNFTMSGGVLVLRREGGSGSQDLGYVNTGSTAGAVTGGTLQFGNSTSPASQSISISTDVPIANLQVASASCTAKALSDFTVTGNVDLLAGKINAFAKSITVGGNWTNAGTFIPGTGAVTFSSSSAQSISCTSGESFYKLTFSGGGAKSLLSAITVSNTLTVDAGNSVDVTSSNNAVTLRSNAVNNGTINFRSGLVTLSGTTSQNLSGASSYDFYDLTLSNSAGAVLSTTATFKGSLTLSAGTLNVTGQSFTLLSDATRTGRIATLGTTGNITGNVIVQRYVPGGTTGWMLLGKTHSSAVTFADWDDDIYITCPGCPDGFSANFYSIYGYDETAAGNQDAAASFVALTGVSDPVVQGKGYWVYSGTAQYTTAPITIDVTGTVNKGNITIPLNYTNHSLPTEDGWNLIANPYPSAISWAALKGSTSNIDNAYYVYNADLNGGSGGYASYVNGVSSPAVASGGIDDNIPMMQGFFVHSTGALSLQALEANKVSNDPVFLKSTLATTRPELRLSLSGLGYSDETMLYCEQGSTAGFDAFADAYKLPPNDPQAPTVALVCDSSAFQVNGIPQVSGTFTTLLKASSGYAGNFVISAEKSGLPPGTCISLLDLHTGVVTDLSSNTYSLSLPDTATVPRFRITITSIPVSVSAAVSQPSCKFTTGGKVIASPAASGAFNYAWKVNGLPVRTIANRLVADTLSGLSSGLVELEVESALCQSGSYSLVVQPQLTVSAVIAGPDSSRTEGFTFFTGNTSSAALSEWNDGQGGGTVSTPSLLTIYHTPGIYTVTLVNFSGTGCSDTARHKLVVLDIFDRIKEQDGSEKISVRTLGDGRYEIQSPHYDSFSVMNSIGQSISCGSFDNGNAIDLSALPAGVYFVKLSGASAQQTLRLLR